MHVKYDLVIFTSRCRAFMFWAKPWQFVVFPARMLSCRLGAGVFLCFVFQRCLVRLGVALLLDRIGCNQHLLLYPDLPSAPCQIIVATFPVDQLLHLSPPSLPDFCQPTQSCLPEPATCVTGSLHLRHPALELTTSTCQQSLCDQ